MGYVLVMHACRLHVCLLRLHPICLLHFHDIWGFVTDGYLECANGEGEMVLVYVEQKLLKENRKKENKALGLIQQGLEGMILSKVSNSQYLKKASVVYLGGIVWGTKGGTHGNNVIMGWVIVNK